MNAVILSGKSNPPPLRCRHALAVARLLAAALFVLLAASKTPARAAPAGASKPNIVFIIADDLGWADVAFHGGNAPTPHLDRLARESLELTHHYVAASCSPTRAGLLSGRYWSRFGVYGPQATRAFPWDTVTLPAALKSMGYETALTGKWHLGSLPEWGPNHFGFDHSYGSLGGGVGPFNHFYKRGPYSQTWHRNEQLITDEGHVTDLVAREAVQWIAQRGSAPFFLYVPMPAVHLPVKEPQEWLDRVPLAINGDVARHYAACIMHLDDAVGRILTAVDEAGKRKNTLVVFTSDNGGTFVENNDRQYPEDDYPNGIIPANNLPLRGTKTHLYEGGIRVPTLVNWRGQIAAGKFDAPLHIVDWMPTLTSLAGYAPAKDLKWDGIDAWPLLTGTARPKPRVLYWSENRNRAIREGDWKLIKQNLRGVETRPTELFNLAQDPYEKTDLAPGMPTKVAALERLLQQISQADGEAAPEKLKSPVNPRR